MVIDAVPKSAVQGPRETALADPTALRRGLVLDARILEITDKGMVRLSTRLGEVSVPAEAFKAAHGDPVAGRAVAVTVRSIEGGGLSFAPTEPGREAVGEAPVSPEAARRAALAGAVAVAAGRQGSLARLFADLQRLAASPGPIPEPVRAAVAEVLSHRLTLDRPPTATDVKNAVLGSGLFLEADLAGTGPGAGAGREAGSDLKAALLGLRRTLDGWAPAGASGVPTAPAGSARAASVGGGAPPPSGSPGQGQAGSAGSGLASDGRGGVAGGTFPPSGLPGVPSTGGPSLSGTGATTASPAGPKTGAAAAAGSASAGLGVAGPGAIPSAVPVGTVVSAGSAPGTMPPLGGSAAGPGSIASTGGAPSSSAPPLPPQPPGSIPGVSPPGSGTSVVGTPAEQTLGAGTVIPGETAPSVGRAEAQILARVFGGLARAAEAMSAGAAPTAPGRAAIRDGGVERDVGVAPPPVRGGDLHAEGPVAPSLLDGAAPAERAAALRSETEGALARILLSQYASLGGETDPKAAASGDRSAPQWTFEVPVLMRGETGTAQFRIERDDQGRSGGREPGKPVWRVRFSMTLEPFGLIHALLSLQGEHLSVGLWAERVEAAAALGAEIAELRDALTAASLEVDEVHCATGAPPAAPAVGAGRLLDRNA